MTDYLAYIPPIPLSPRLFHLHEAETKGKLAFGVPAQPSIGARFHHRLSNYSPDLLLILTAAIAIGVVVFNWRW
jgi:hypothetical protein